MSEIYNEEKRKKVSQLLVLEIQRILEDMYLREDFLVNIWSKHRDRGPFIDTVFSRWHTVDFDTLIELDITQVSILEQFYRELEDLRFTFQYTDAMPTTLRQVYHSSLSRLTQVGLKAIDSLGGELSLPIDFGTDYSRAYEVGLNRSPNTDISES
jgi:hypothetical protein